MLYSLTGFSRKEEMIHNTKVVIDIKTLNSKALDMNIKLPPAIRSQEGLMRKELTKHIKRGKIEMMVQIESEDVQLMPQINTSLYKALTKQLLQLNQELSISGDISQALLRQQGMLVQNDSIEESLWEKIHSVFLSAVEEVQQFRAQEGQHLEDEFVRYLQKIEEKAQQIEVLAPQRIQRIKERISDNMDRFTSKDDIQWKQDRLEQEMIFYIEKLDITEEIIRLKSHNMMFLNELQNEVIQKGKKLTFISQEMGREINTIGSKAQDKDIQIHVIEMKDDLEKIKEQLSNIL